MGNPSYLEVLVIPSPTAAKPDKIEEKIFILQL